jgi:cbb3-type cytochrome c oxidase subunit III
MAEHNEIDQVTGTATTGHQWDGIKELNTPLPRWWVITFYITIVWSIGYWIVYPAWPLVASHTTGLFGYSSRADVAVELANLEKIRGDKMVKLGAASLVEIEKDPALLALARARGKTVFGDNCAPCHGSGGAGAKGYPNLNDDEWIWGGSLDKILERSVRRPLRACKATKAPCWPSARSPQEGPDAPSPITSGRYRAADKPGYDAAAVPRSSRITAPRAMATTARATRNSVRPISRR